MKRVVLVLFCLAVLCVPDIRDAVFGNVGNLLAFRVGESDADILAREFGHAFAAVQFSDLPNYEVLMRKMRRNEVADPFHAKTLAPMATRHGRRDSIIRRSRERYATPRTVVEQRIERWMQRDNPRMNWPLH